MKQSIYMKHSMTHAKDCRIEWEADFAKMELVIYVDFISPHLLVDWLESVHHYDDRFEKTKVIGAITICERFDVFLVVAPNKLHSETVGFGTTYLVKAYTPRSYDENVKAKPELELFLSKTIEDALPKQEFVTLNDIMEDMPADRRAEIEDGAEEMAKEIAAAHLNK